MSPIATNTTDVLQVPMTNDYISPHKEHRKR